MKEKPLMYYVQIPLSTEIDLIACGSGGEIVLPKKQQDVLLIYLRKGRAYITYQSLTQSANTGDIITVINGTKVSLSEDSSFDWLTFSHDCLQAVNYSKPINIDGEEFLLSSQLVCIRPAQFQFLINYLIETQNNHFMKQIKCKNLTKLILCEVTQLQYYLSKKMYSQKYFDILSWLQNHYTEKISLEVLSTQFNYNKVYLCRLFKSITGETIIKFITRLRIERAMHLLLETSESVKNIAYQVGYSDDKQFIRSFRKVNGITASQFRKQNVINN